MDNSSSPALHIFHAARFRNPSANGTDPDYFELGWVPPLDTGGCALTGYRVERLLDGARTDNGAVDLDVRRES